MFKKKNKGKNMEQKLPILESNDMEVILVMHNECVFYDEKQKV